MQVPEMTGGTNTSSAVATSSAEASSALDLAAIFEPVRAELRLVEEFLRSNLIDDNQFITELLNQIARSGGKRIRPALTLLCSKATAPVPGEIGRLHIVLAVLTELIHTASLVHDDVIDRASMRRGQETINHQWNDKLAVLLGDLLFAQASVCLARIMHPGIVGIYGQVLGDLCAGEIRQMRQQFICTVDWDSYIKKSIGKTASLFAAGCQSGAILHGRPDDVVAAMRDFGLNLGVCFQIVDDLLDVTASSSALGKAAGSDLAQGVITAPALFVLEGGGAAGKRLESLIKSRAVTQPEGIAEALEIIRSAGGISATAELARCYAELSREALHVLPVSPYRDSLEMAVDYILLRTR